MAFAVNDEGVAALNALADCLQSSLATMGKACNALGNASHENQRALGPHAEELVRLIDDTRQSHYEVASPALELHGKVESLAKSYQAIIASKLNAGGSGGGGSGGGGSGGGGSGGSGGLTATKQTWKKNEDGTSTFNTPTETGELLDSNQGKVEGFSGTCGLVSCVNILRLAGVNATEKQIVDYASKNGLCARGHKESGNNGGTGPSKRQAILSHFGVQSELRTASVESIVSAVSEGRGVIASFDAGRLWDNPDYYNEGHAVVITSVKKDADGNNIGVFICDSGTGGKDKATFYPVNRIRDSLRPGRPINVTSVIR